MPKIIQFFFLLIYHCTHFSLSDTHHSHNSGLTNTCAIMYNARSIVQNRAVHQRYPIHVSRTTIALKAKHALTDCAIIHAFLIMCVHQQQNVSPLSIDQCALVRMDTKEIRLLNVHQLHHVRNNLLT